MNNIEHISVSVQQDFIERQTRARPLTPLSELIWNSLDADASEVKIEFERNDLANRISKIIVCDDGVGFSRDDAATLFGNLGGSWKRQRRKTPIKNRMVHGFHGRGRYKAFTLGRYIKWIVNYNSNNNQIRLFEINLLESNIKDVAISEEKVADDPETGVVVEICNLKTNFDDSFFITSRQKLTETFAPYLINYKEVVIKIESYQLEPEKAIANQVNFELPPVKDVKGKEYSVSLEMIEWKSVGSKTLYLCSNEGFPLVELETRFKLPDFVFSGYLKSNYFTEMFDKDKLDAAELDPNINQLIESAKTHIKNYFREKTARLSYGVVESWKNEKTYPFEGEPSTEVEKVERQIFDIVALHVQDYSPDLQNVEPRTRAFHMRLLRNAIEQSPNDLQIILNEVLKLPKDKREELSNLLQETTLASIITAAKLVADRLKFITSLESIVFDKKYSKQLKERSQLHMIIAEHTWIFGEKYNLWASDRDLKRILEKHKKHLDSNIVIDKPVDAIGKKRAIVDLMMSRSIRRNRAEDIEHLVVELKAPNVKIGPDEITQAKRYAMAVSKDDRFHSIKGIRWHFWIVSNGYTEFAKEDIDGGPDPEQRLVHRNNNVFVGIKTWGEIIEQNRSSLHFIQEKLKHFADENEALRFLHQKHSKYLNGIIDEKNNNESA